MAHVDRVCTPRVGEGGRNKQERAGGHCTPEPLSEMLENPSGSSGGFAAPWPGHVSEVRYSALLLERSTHTSVTRNYPYTTPVDDTSGVVGLSRPDLALEFGTSPEASTNPLYHRGA